MAEPTAWAAIVDILAAQDVTVLFGLPGDDLAALDAVRGGPARLVLCRDQRNAVFMASGYALASGRLGVCVVGKGPAVANAVGGIVEARAGGVPLLLLAGGTPAVEAGSGAFQELDQLRLVRPVVKWAARVEVPERVPEVLERAVLVATGGAPGPVYVEIPDDIAAAPARAPRAPRRLAAQRPGPDPAALADSLGALRGRYRPIMLVGGGARPGGAALAELAGRLGAAAFVTASGRGAFPEDHPLFCGLSGLYAGPPLAELWSGADVVVTLGSRLEETARYGWERHLPRDTPFLQVNVEESDVDTTRPGGWLLADVRRTVDAWLAGRLGPPDERWLARIAAARAALHTGAADRLKAMDSTDRLHVAEVLAALHEALPADRLMVHENGLQDIWSYLYPYWTAADRGAIVPSEQTSLGFGMAAAIGAALAGTGRPVIAFGGDGAFHLVRGDLGTAVGAGAAVLWIVLDNGGYGWLQAQWAQRSDRAGYTFTPDHASGSAAIAAGLGMWSGRVEHKADLRPLVARATAECAAGRPALLEVRVRLDDAPPGFETLAGEFPA